jgi:hypothetical protein
MSSPPWWFTVTFIAGRIAKENGKFDFIILNYVWLERRNETYICFQAWLIYLVIWVENEFEIKPEVRLIAKFARRNIHFEKQTSSISQLNTIGECLFSNNIYQQTKEQFKSWSAAISLYRINIHLCDLQGRCLFLIQLQLIYANNIKVKLRVSNL